MKGARKSSSSFPKRIVLDEDTLIPLLARRSCHLPGNDWWADWRQWFWNNHILFGVCLHHPWHPVEWWERSLALTASISFGLVATNGVYNYFLDDPDAMNTELLSYQAYSITQGMVVLWTLGGLCHSVFDMIVWNIMACACCHPGGRFGESGMSPRCRDVGSYMLIPVILSLLALAVYLVLLRASKQEEMYLEVDDDDLYVDVDKIEGIEAFAFLIKYAIELSLTWCVYFPILGTIQFSGILGCNGRLPGLGGRPRDIRIVQEELELARYAKF
jgi:hypothetical protein